MSESARMEKDYNLYRYQASWRAWCAEERQWHCYSKDEAQACEIDELVEKKFEGSLPAFIAAFTKHQAMSEDELDEMQRMIDRIRKGGSQ